MTIMISYIGFGGRARRGRTHKNRESWRGLRLDQEAIVKPQLLTRRLLDYPSAETTWRTWSKLKFSFLGKSDDSENYFISLSVYKVRKNIYNPNSFTQEG